MELFAESESITLPLPDELPIEVDLGCARGHFLEAMARFYPNRFFLGIERLKDRYEKTARRIEPLPNARVWRADCRQAVETLLPKGRIETIYISFPDPWPKRRHHRRRLVSSEFLQKCARTLTTSGRLRLMTDHFGYFTAMQTAAKACHELAEEKWDSTEELPLTEFQTRFLMSGTAIYRLTLKKIFSVP